MAPLETVPDSKVTGRWADEADAEAETQAAATTSEEAAPDSLTVEVTRGDTIYAPAKKFEDLNLSPELLEGLYVGMKFKNHSKMQASVLPMILTPPLKNLVVQTHSGSGKTSFVLGMLSPIDTKLTAPQALCICSTNELAIQNMEVLMRMGKLKGITSELAIPDRAIRKRPPITAQIVIGTPGTIRNLVTLKKLSMSFMKILVFDEADHMLAQDGFRDDSRKVMKTIVQSSSDCQVLLFSATVNDGVSAFVDQIKDFFNKDYNQILVKKEEPSPASVEQYKVKCPDKLTKVMVVKDKILELRDRVGQTIIIVRTRNSIATLQRSFVDLGYEVTTIQEDLKQEDLDKVIKESTIQEDLKQEDPDKIIKESKEGLTSVSISPDVLAHGFDQVQTRPGNNVDPSMADNTRYPLEDQIKKLSDRVVEIEESLARQNTEFQEQMPCNNVDPSMADNTRYPLEDQIKKLSDRVVEIEESLARRNTEFQEQMLELQNQVSSIQMNERMRFLKMEKQPIEEETSSSIQMNERMRFLKMEKQPIEEETSYRRNFLKMEKQPIEEETSSSIQMNERMRFLKMEKQPIEEETSYRRNLVQTSQTQQISSRDPKKTFGPRKI